MWVYIITEKLFSIFVFCVFTSTERYLQSRLNSDICRTEARIQMKSHIAYVQIVKANELFNMFHSPILTNKLLQ